MDSNNKSQFVRAFTRGFGYALGYSVAMLAMIPAEDQLRKKFSSAKNK